MKNMKGRDFEMKLLKFDGNEFEVLNIEGDKEPELEFYYTHIGCRYIDIVYRKVEDRWFDIVCDNEGLLVEKPIVTAINAEDFSPMLCGTLIFAHHDSEGNLTGLSDEDIKVLKSATIPLYDAEAGTIRRVSCMRYR